MAKKKARKDPPVGATFERIYLRKTYRLEVISKDGMIGYKVGKDVFGSPSGAAKAIIKREVNGWKFWGMDG